VPFASELQRCCQSAKACPDDKNDDACAWVCADWCELHRFIFGDRTQDSACRTGRVRIDSDSGWCVIVDRQRLDIDQAFETHVERFVKLSTTGYSVWGEGSNGFGSVARQIDRKRRVWMRQDDSLNLYSHSAETIAFNPWIDVHSLGAC
jgi:hypothetical protein